MCKSSNLRQFSTTLLNFWISYHPTIRKKLNYIVLCRINKFYLYETKRMMITG